MSDELLRRLRKHPVIAMDKQNVTADAAVLIEQLTDENRELREAVRQFIKADDDVYNFLTSIEKSKPSHANQFSIREEKYIALKEALAKQGDKYE